jgi:hypothetical protein
VSHEELDFASFYEASRDDCLRTVLASTGDIYTAQDLVAEAFARAWASWRKVSRHPAPRAWVVRTALNAGVSSWRKRRRDRPLPSDDSVATVGGLADGLVDPMGRELIAVLKEPFGGVHMTTPVDQVTRHGRAVRTHRRRQRGLTGAVTLAGSAIAAVALLGPGGHPLAAAGHPVASGNHPATARLAAWIITRDPDGGITVSVNQMKNPAGLQATLRADGIPARVTFDPLRWMTQPLPAGCAAPKMSDRANAQLQSKILTPPAIWKYQQQLMRRFASTPITITYTLHGHVRHTTFPRSGVAWQKELQQLRKEGAQHITVTGVGVASTMPSSLRKVQEKEEQDATGRSALYINPGAIPAGIGLSVGVDAASPDNFSYGVDLVVTSPRCTGS